MRVPPSQPVRNSRPGLVLLPQASGPCSALPTVYQGGALLFAPDIGPPHRLRSRRHAPALHRRAPMRLRRRHSRPAARRLAELGSQAAILDRG
ncbi:hypothetical protein NDU88_002693 [Pleurodeles waltl]|uniref:Uncharacterized protein n=1 Tax=Pleurodeles waltl TaxID=8319 RepID=A0AAV7W426_PLEWA|nr:hypothetical protein NDU88_002693 [Pleurodeles waltl]